MLAPTRFVGRADEIDSIEGALERASAEEPALVLLIGEAGVGKTTLIEQAAQRAAERGFSVVVGPCIDAEGGLPFAPIRSAFRGLGSQYDADAIDRLVDRHPHVGTLLAGTTDPTGLADAWDDPVVLYESVLDVFGELGQHRSLALFLEDLHWADRSTLELLTFIVRNLTGERLLLIATIRDDELDASSPLGRSIIELSRNPRVERVDLGGLGPGEIAALVTDVVGQQPDEEVLETLVARSGGNPFFAVELARAGAASASQLPRSLADILTLRLQGLDDDASSVLRTAAVFGTSFPSGSLARLMNISEEVVERALRVAFDAGIISADPESGELRFRHALFQEVVYRTMLPGEQRRLHAAVAELLGDEPDRDPAVLAHHYALAGLPVPSLMASLDAARTAAGAFGSVDAVPHYRRVVDLWTSVDDASAKAGTELADLLIEATACALNVGQSEDGIEFAEQALSEIDPETDAVKWADVAVRLSELQWELGNDGESHRLLDEAARHLGGHRDSLTWARLLDRKGFLAAVSGDGDAGSEAASGAVELARRFGDATVEVDALARLGIARSIQGRIAEGIDLLSEAFDRALEARIPKGLARATINQLMILYAAVRLDDAVRVGQDGLAACEELGLPHSYRAAALARYAHVLVVTGRWEEAADLVAGASQPQGKRYAAYLAAARAHLALGRGDFDGARKGLADAEIGTGGILHFAIQVAALEAELALAEGRYDEVLSRVDQNLEVASLLPETSTLRLCALALDAAHWLPEGAVDIDRYSDFGEKKAEQLRTTVDLPPADLDAWLAVIRARHARLVGNPAHRHWAAAVKTFEAAGLVVRRAWSQLRLAECMVEEAGDRAVAAELAGEVHELSTRLGAAPLRCEVEDLIRRARLTVAGVSSASTNDLGLTERETEVLRLVAEGRTNREIADALYISPRTASVHVSNILRKVGAANRGEAAAAAHRHGLIAS